MNAFPQSSPFYHQLDMSEFAGFDPNKVPSSPPPNQHQGTPEQLTSYRNEVDRIRFTIVDTLAAMARGDYPTVKALLEQIEDALTALV